MHDDAGELPFFHPRMVEVPRAAVVVLIGWIGEAGTLERSIAEWIGQVLVPRRSDGEEEKVHPLATKPEEMRAMLARTMW